MQGPRNSAAGLRSLHALEAEAVNALGQLQQCRWHCSAATAGAVAGVVASVVHALAVALVAAVVVVALRPPWVAVLFALACLPSPLA
jgi:hypothetical protein